MDMSHFLGKFLILVPGGLRRMMKEFRNKKDKVEIRILRTIKKNQRRDAQSLLKEIK